MKLVIKNLLVILLITNLSTLLLTKESTSNALNTLEKTDNKSTAKNTKSNNKNEKSEQILVNTVRTHHYEEADEAPPGSIASRVIPNPSVVIKSPVQAAIPAMVKVAQPSPVPRLVTANEWKIPFPVVKPVPNNSVMINRPVLGPPPQALNIGFGNPAVKVVNMGGVPPRPVPILKPGVTRVVQFPMTGSSFNTNFEGNIDSIDDLKISSIFFNIYFKYQHYCNLKKIE